MYKPLPDSLTIKPSKVNGLGLFAKEAIPQATNLGMTHLEIGKTILRTPLGGFINHANDSNCIKVLSKSMINRGFTLIFLLSLLVGQFLFYQ